MEKNTKVGRNTFIFIGLTYLLYFGQLGILTPYLSVFLDGRDFSSKDIGTLLAFITLTRIIGPSLWAGLADKSGKPLHIMRLGCFLSACLFAGVFFVHGFFWLTLVFGAMMLFWTAVLPQLEVITLQHLKSSKLSYGKIRLWGSVGFILFTVITGMVIDLKGSESPIWISMCLLFVLFLSSLALNETSERKPSETTKSNLWLLALKRPFVVFLIASFLLQMSFGTFYGFFALYLRDLNYSGFQTGLLIALGVVSEIGIFLIASKVINKLGVKLTLLISFFATALRWWLLGFFGNWAAIVVVSQLIHALSFGLIHATSVHFIHHYFPANFQSRGQAIYISVSFGVGGALGHYVSGSLWNNGSGATVAYAIAGILSLLGAIFLLFTSSKSMDEPAANEQT